jgi:hypothetical protein
VSSTRPKKEMERTMKRTIVMVLLAMGAVGGYASGFAHMHRCGREHQAAFERHVADVCVAAAKGSSPRAASHE